MTLPVKVVLTLVSVACYVLIVRLADRFDWSGPVFGFQWPFHVIGLVFGALVMAPYALRSAQRLPRMIALSVASAVIYYAAVRFVVDGPFGYSSLASHLIAGSGAALLTGLAVAALAPARPSGRLIVLTLVAGTLGGAAFEWHMPIEWGPNDLHAYLAWQLLVCLALDRGFLPSMRPAS